jgi:hypothetical protein
MPFGGVEAVTALITVQPVLWVCKRLSPDPVPARFQEGCRGFFDHVLACIALGRVTTDGTEGGSDLARAPAARLEVRAGLWAQKLAVGSLFSGSPRPKLLHAAVA